MSDHTRRGTPSSSRIVRGLGALVLSAAAVAALAGAAPAPLAAPLAAPFARPAASQPSNPTELNEYVARSITRAALMDLRFTADPGPGDYRIAAILMGLAHDLLPKDQEIIRRLIEASDGAGDKDAVLRWSRTLLREDGRDTVALLRLISASIVQNSQTADDRLRLYEAYLSGPAAAKFDPAIRSRLALDAALLLREAGDTRGFLEKLTLATQLDPTHKEAHHLAATVFAEQRPDDAVGRLQMLEHLLMADPMDPNVHLSISRELAGGRAFGAARRFHNNALSILGALGTPSDRASLESLVLAWHVEGPGAVAARLNQDLTAARERAAREIRRLTEMGRSTDRLTKPEDIRLGIPHQSLYAMAVNAAGDEAASRAAIAETVAQFAAMLGEIDQAASIGRMPVAEANQRKLDLAVQIQTLRLWAGLQAEDAKRDIDANPVLREAFPEGMAVLDGWLQIRTGQVQAGMDALLRHSDQNVFALLGVGVGHESLGETQRAVEIYDRVLRLAPLEVTGAWARSRLQALGFKQDAGAVAQLERAVKDIPGAIGAGMVEDPRRYIQLTVALAEAAPESIDRTPLRITLRNMSQYPLALGSNRALNSRLMVLPRMENFNLGQLPLMRPEIIDLDRRLRLMPFETLEVEVWPDSGQSGWLMEALANRSVRVRWRVIQGPVVDAQGSFRPGPMCLTTETDAVVRAPLPEAQLTIEGLAYKVATDPPEVMRRLAAATRSIVLQPLLVPALGGVPRPGGQPGEAAPPPEADFIRPAAESFAARYPTLPATTRAMLAAVLPHERLSPGMAPFDRAVAADSDPLVLCVVLALRVADAGDPLLARALESDDPRVKELAALVSERLKRGEMTYARLSAEALRSPPPASPSSPADPGSAPPAPPGAGK